MDPDLDVVVLRLDRNLSSVRLIRRFARSLNSLCSAAMLITANVKRLRPLALTRTYKELSVMSAKRASSVPADVTIYRISRFISS